MGHLSIPSQSSSRSSATTCVYTRLVVVTSSCPTCSPIQARYDIQQRGWRRGRGEETTDDLRQEFISEHERRRDEAIEPRCHRGRHRMRIRGTHGTSDLRSHAFVA